MRAGPLARLVPARRVLEAACLLGARCLLVSRSLTGARAGLSLRGLLAFCCLLGAYSLLGAGCRLDVVRIRAGNPLDKKAFEKLEVDRTTREEVARELGAPEKVEWKAGSNEEYLWYLYGDMIDTGLRFQFPPFRSFFGYQHTFLRLDQNSDEVNAMELVFDERGVLRNKSLRLSKAYPTESRESGRWRFHVSPHGEYSYILPGDAGFADYDEIFANGYRAGFDVGFQPVPVFSLIAGGNYQEYGGESVSTSAGKVTLGDLQMAQIEVGIRLEIPLVVLGKLGKMEEVKRLLFEDDPSRAGGFKLYVQGTTGATLTKAVPVKIDGVRSGDFYHDSFAFSGGVGAGIEYEWAWGAASVGISYQAIGAAREGDSPLDSEGDGLDSVLLGATLDVSF